MKTTKLSVACMCFQFLE